MAIYFARVDHDQMRDVVESLRLRQPHRIKVTFHANGERSAQSNWTSGIMPLECDLYLDERLSSPVSENVVVNMIGYVRDSRSSPPKRYAIFVAYDPINDVIEAAIDNKIPLEKIAKHPVSPG